MEKLFYIYMVIIIQVSEMLMLYNTYNILFLFTKHLLTSLAIRVAFLDVFFAVELTIEDTETVLQFS